MLNRVRERITLVFMTIFRRPQTQEVIEVVRVESRPRLRRRR